MPSYIRPSDDPQAAFEQIKQAYQDGTYQEWAQGPTLDTTFVTHLTIGSTVQETGWIELANTLLVQVESSPAPEHVNFAIEGQCGAGGTVRYFPPVLLDANFSTYSTDTTFTEFDYFYLEPGAFEVFELTYVCKSPGTYRFELRVPYVFQGQRGDITTHNPVEFVCPQTYTVWSASSFEHESAFYGAKNYAWNGSGYEEVP
jgi:hypothetical protein